MPQVSRDVKLTCSSAIELVVHLEEPSFYVEVLSHQLSETLM